jgi:KDO2-lipid IV(A) lauroyltransferase
MFRRVCSSLECSDLSREGGRTARDWLYYASARSVTTLVQVLPWSVGRQVARLMGFMAYLLDRPSRREEAIENLCSAFPFLRRQRAVSILREVYGHLAESFVDALQFARVVRQGRIASVLEPVGFEKLAGLPNTTGLVFVTGHFGHWELLGAAAALLGYPVWSVGRPFLNVFIDRYVRDLREGTGQRMVDKRGALPRMIRLVRAGQNVALLIDQDARKQGIFVDFFGRPASTTPSAALIALRTGAPVVFVCARRLDGQNRFQVQVKDVVPPSAEAKNDAEIHRITQRLTKDLEAVIREAPSQWLWLHRRWKTYPGKYERL